MVGGERAYCSNELMHSSWYNRIRSVFIECKKNVLENNAKDVGERSKSSISGEMGWKKTLTEVGNKENAVN
jgi:hypothetical protein